MIRSYSFESLLENFKFQGIFVESSSHVCGHINETFILNFKKDDGTTCKYILQKINSNVFKSPEKLMENIKNVTTHISNKVLLASEDPLRATINIIPTIDAKTFYKSPNGDYWRAMVFIEGARTYEMVEKPEHLYTTGKAIGRFQQQLSDFPAELLHETIPDFHNTEKRYEDFLDAVKTDTKGRASTVRPEIDFVISRGEETKILVNMLKEGKLTLRVTHNDTKFNNIMIDDITGEGIAVIDLDTVMPGLSLYDFGDSIRSGATTALEDEADLSKVSFDLNLFEYFTKGYIEAVKDSLTEVEIEYLPFSAKLITLELGMRFLMDHINGDIYFKIHRENHNLDRARNQFKLVADMEEQMENMKNIIKKYI